ncbi:MAG: BrnT family toxin [Bryobacterales bacterium]|nr:BrnT family toxin [Bryobacterales bacterium]
MPNPESEFEWDEEKHLANLSKHGIRFEDAARIFDSDPLVLRARAGSEDRWMALGLTEGGVIAVVFTERNGRRRLISARPAARRERRDYNTYKRDRIQMGLQTPEPPWDESKQVPDEDIDFSDIPEIESWEWKYARPMSHPEAFSRELSEAYDAEWHERNRQNLAQREESKKP